MFRHPDHNVCLNIYCPKSWVGERNHFLSFLFLARFCTFSLNVDSLLRYSEVASDFQSETLTVFPVTSTTSTSDLIVVISFNSHDTAFASWHIFTCHNVLRLFKNSHNTKFRVVAVSLMPQRVVVVFSAHWAFSIFGLNTYITMRSQSDLKFM
jgi:hypothetical protein